MDIMGAREAKLQLREGIFPLPEEGLTERHHSKVFVEVPGGFDPNCKEIGELSRAEMRALEPGLRIRVVNRLLERYLTEQGHLDLLEGWRPISGAIRDVAPANLHSADQLDKSTCA